MPTTEFFQIAGKKTQITMGGSGPPLVYLHSAAGDCDWQPFLEQLAQHYTVYVPAHPGFALSAGLDEIRGMDDLAWHYVDLLDRLYLKNVPVMGLSLGAWLACELAVLRPELVSHLVLASAAGLHVPGAPIAELFIDNLETLRRLIFHHPDAAYATEAIPSSIDDPRILMWLRASEATARVAWNPYLHNPKLLRHLRRIPCPTLVVWGGQDRVIPLAHGECYQKNLPQATLRVIDDCGHMLPQEKPDEFVAMTIEFLTKT